MANFSIPKEIKEQEHRVALLPSAAYQLAKRGHQVFVERGEQGVGAGYPDADYAAAGATLLDSHEAVFAAADMIVKVKEPLPCRARRCCGRGKCCSPTCTSAAAGPLTGGADASPVAACAWPTRRWS
jgi:alanine dehydrogenase